MSDTDKKDYGVSDEPRSVTAEGENSVPSASALPYDAEERAGRNKWVVVSHGLEFRGPAMDEYDAKNWAGWMNHAFQAGADSKDSAERTGGHVSDPINQIPDPPNPPQGVEAARLLRELVAAVCGAMTAEQVGTPDQIMACDARQESAIVAANAFLTTEIQPLSERASRLADLVRCEIVEPGNIDLAGVAIDLDALATALATPSHGKEEGLEGAASPTPSVTATVEDSDSDRPPYSTGVPHGIPVLIYSDGPFSGVFATPLVGDPNQLAEGNGDIWSTHGEGDSVAEAISNMTIGAMPTEQTVATQPPTKPGETVEGAAVVLEGVASCVAPDPDSTTQFEPFIQVRVEDRQGRINLHRDKIPDGPCTVTIQPTSKGSSDDE